VRTYSYRYQSLIRTASATGVVVLHFDFLYPDTESCERCMGTEAALETALKLVGPVLTAGECVEFVASVLILPD